MSDYAGQDLGSLVRAFVEQQRLPYSPIRYGHINSLILLVDLMPAPATGAAKPKTANEPNSERVRQHIEEWNEQALDAVFGLFTKSSLTFVCLFVNKADLIDGNTEVLERQCVELFQPLIQRLERRGRGRLVKIIVGSAATGQGLPLVKEHLVRESVSDTTENV